MISGGRRAAAVLSVVATAVTVSGFGASASAHPTDPSHPSHPSIIGKALAPQTSLKPTAKMAQVMSGDDTAHMDHNGALYYVDPAPKKPAHAATPRLSAGRVTVSPMMAIPALHSRSGSTHKIFLDFDGYTTPVGNKWANNGGNSIPVGTVSGPFSLDGDPAFSATELAYIQKVWRIVSEKYAPYDVDVTTVDPGKAGYERTDPSDVNYGTHVVITSDSGAGSALQDVCSGACAGIAYNDLQPSTVGPFSTAGNTNFEPAWVFSSQTFGSAQMTAHGAAHEIGHTMGLSHDGLTTVGGDNYYEGHANWVPIMGLTDQNAVAQWSKGEYADANNTEDDLAVIAKNGNNGTAGSLLLPDDYGSGTTPTDLGDQTSYSVDGVIASAGDDDLFSINRTCTDALTVSASGIGSGQSLDIKLDILDASNSQLATDNQPSDQNTAVQPDGDVGYLPEGMDASTSLPATSAGTTYRVRVSGSGNGTASTGYTTYGSIGGYHLTISGCPSSGNTAPGQPATVTATPAVKAPSGTITWTAPTDDGGSAVTGYTITGLPDGPHDVSAATFSFPATGLTPGVSYDVAVAAKNVVGTGTAKHASLRVATWVPTTAPKISASAKGTTVTLKWTQPSNPGHAVGTSWTIRVYVGSTLIDTETAAYGTIGEVFSATPGRYKMVVYLNYVADSGTHSPSASTYVDAGPSAPRIGTPSSGASGGSVNVTARWSAPSTLRGCTISYYVIAAYRVSSTGHVSSSPSYVSSHRSASSRSYTWALRAGKYRFRVQARACGGYTGISSYSAIATSR